MATTDGGMDELLTILGHNIKSSNTTKVSRKLEQLEEGMYSV